MSVVILLLLGVAAIGALIMWRLWVSIKKLYNANGDEVPKSMIMIHAGLTFCTIAIPLIPAIFIFIYYA